MNLYNLSALVFETKFEIVKPITCPCNSIANFEVKMVNKRMLGVDNERKNNKQFADCINKLIAINPKGPMDDQINDPRG